MIIFGTGYGGLVMGFSLANFCHDVLYVDDGSMCIAPSKLSLGASLELSPRMGQPPITLST